MRMLIAIIFILGACLVIFVNSLIVLRDLLTRIPCPSPANLPSSDIAHPDAAIDDAPDESFPVGDHPLAGRAAHLGGDDS
jgi:hypothetical protein